MYENEADSLFEAESYQGYLNSWLVYVNKLFSTPQILGFNLDSLNVSQQAALLDFIVPQSSSLLHNRLLFS